MADRRPSSGKPAGLSIKSESARNVSFSLSQPTKRKFNDDGTTEVTTTSNELNIVDPKKQKLGNSVETTPISILKRKTLEEKRPPPVTPQTSEKPQPFVQPKVSKRDQIIKDIAKDRATKGVKEQPKDVKEQPKKVKPKQPKKPKPNTPAKAHRTADVIEYMTTFHSDKENWKFNKAKQNNLLKDVFDVEKIPSEHDAALQDYLSGLQGEHNLEDLQTRAKDICDLDVNDGLEVSELSGTGTEDADGSSNEIKAKLVSQKDDDTPEQKQQRQDYAHALLRFKTQLKHSTLEREDAPSELEGDWQKRLEKRQRAEKILHAIEPNVTKLRLSKALQKPQPEEVPVPAAPTTTKKRARRRKRRTDMSSDESSSSDSSSDSDSNSDSDDDIDHTTKNQPEVGTPDASSAMNGAPEDAHGRRKKESEEPENRKRQRSWERIRPQPGEPSPKPPRSRTASRRASKSDSEKSDQGSHSGSDNDSASSSSSAASSSSSSSASESESSSASSSEAESSSGSDVKSSEARRIARRIYKLQSKGGQSGSVRFSVPSGLSSEVSESSEDDSDDSDSD